MPAIQVVSTKPASGKTTVAVALAQGFADAGGRVRLERIGTGEAANADALTFGGYTFAASGGEPLSQAPEIPSDHLLILELDAGATPLPAIPAVIALRGQPSDADTALATPMGDRLLGTIAVGVNPAAIEAVARDITNSGLRPLALLPEERGLAAPSVAEIGETLNAEVLFAADNENEVVQDILIAPVYSDPARPHFHRFASKAILSPFNKTDLHLAAIESQAACLVITGGKQPSPYIIDRANHGNTTLLLSRHDTPGTVNALAGVWTNSRFRGDAKASAAYALLKDRIDFAALARKLS
ncbi:MAG TPA: DRTGG domain-containing protein, partial [Dehalococcoidia bacterium]|nr:DRTGG domain-containing protein [Dehalococcoidia bacterium]